MFKVVLSVEFKTPLPSEVLEAIHRIRDSLEKLGKCVCSDVPPLLCLCSNAIVKLIFSIESPGTSGIRSLTTPHTFRCVIEGKEPGDVFEVLDDVVKVLRKEEARIKLVG